MSAKTIAGFLLVLSLATPVLFGQTVTSHAVTSSGAVSVVPPNAVPISGKTCVMGTLASYIALGSGGCIFNNAIFANFSYSGTVAASVTSAAGIKPEQILVIPVPPGPIVTPTVTPYYPGLNFSASWQAGRAQTMVSVIHYTVTPAPASTAIEGGVLTLQLGRAQIFGMIGRVTVQESTNVGTLTVEEQCTEVCRIKRLDSLEFSPLQELLITDTITLNGGLNGASLYGFTANFNSCVQCAQPE